VTTASRDDLLVEIEAWETANLNGAVPATRIERVLAQPVGVEWAITLGAAFSNVRAIGRAADPRAAFEEARRIWLQMHRACQRKPRR